MKHLKPFNESIWLSGVSREMQDIVNIASDEGITIERCHERRSKYKRGFYKDRYSLIFKKPDNMPGYMKRFMIVLEMLI